MAQVRPLKLKSEIGRATHALSPTYPFARVLINPPAPNISSYLDYSVPAPLGEVAQVGFLVEVPFNNKNILGIIVERMEKPTLSGRIREIVKVIGSKSVTDQAHLSMIQKASSFYGCREWDLIRSAIPAFSALGEKSYSKRVADENSQPAFSAKLPEDLRDWLRSSKRILGVIELEKTRPFRDSVLDIAGELKSHGALLIVLPTEREIEIFRDLFAQSGLSSISLSNSLTKSERYANFLSLKNATFGVFVGNRSSVLAPLHQNSTILVVDDLHSAHYERSSPTWNTRQVALLRARERKIVFASTAPSLELIYYAQNGEIMYYNSPSAPTLKVTFPRASDANNYYEVISRGLKRGKVLVVRSQRGFINSFSCQKCRNLAICSCGGKLILPKKGVAPVCSMCDKNIFDWKCNYCHSQDIRSVQTGVEKIGEDLAKSFPGVNVVVNSSDKKGEGWSHSDAALVIATPGMEEVAMYSAIIFMNGESITQSTDLRSQEILRLQTLNTLSSLEVAGEIFARTLPDSHFAAMVRTRIFKSLALEEIQQRNEVHLPPSHHLLVVDCLDLTVVNNVFSSNPNLEIVGPIKRKNIYRSIIKVPLKARSEVISLLVDVNRVRSLRKQPLLTYYLDPFNLDF